jgi:hypothetical protein
MMGDGGNKGDPFNFAQNKKSLLGKIMRLDVNTLPSKHFSLNIIFMIMAIGKYNNKPWLAGTYFE